MDYAVDVPHYAEVAPYTSQNVEVLAGDNWYLSELTDSTPFYQLVIEEPEVLPPLLDESEAEIPVEVVEQAKPLVAKEPTSVYFNTARWNLSAKTKTTLNNLDHDASYRLEGHTDPRGTSASNVRLAAKRSHSVSEDLRAQGIKVDGSKSVGEASPLASEGDPAKYHLDRRVDLIPTK